MTVAMGQPQAGTGVTSTTKAKLHQTLAALGVFLINMTTGLGVGWSSPGWIKMTTPDLGPFVCDLDEASWVVAIYDVGIPLGSVLSGALLGTAGRRRTLMVAPCLVLLASALTYFATSIPYLNVARIVLGVSFGIDLSCSSLYIGEIASIDMRGKLCTFTTSVVFVGVLLQYSVGPFVSYWTQALLFVPPALLSFAIFTLWAPESPYFLATKGKSEEMYCSLVRLRGVQDYALVEKEAVMIRNAMEEEVGLRKRNRRALLREFLSSRGNRRGCAIVLFLCGTGPMIGTGSLLSYAQYMFKATGSALTPEASSIVMCSVQVVAGFASSQVIDRAGRRPLLMASACCNFLALGAVGSFFFVKDYLRLEEVATSLSWIPLAALIAFMISTNLGTTTVPWVLIGELLPPQSKTFVPSLSVLGFSVVALGTNKLFPVLGERVGLFVPFWVFGAWSLLVAAFTYRLVPETRGKSLLEVQAMLRSRTTSTSSCTSSSSGGEDGATVGSVHCVQEMW